MGQNRHVQDTSTTISVRAARWHSSTGFAVKMGAAQEHPLLPRNPWRAAFHERPAMEYLT